MQIIIQRVLKASVIVENEPVSKIEKGFLILFGVHKDDEETDIDYLIHKIINLRIFEDENGKFNLSIKEVNGQILLVPQFTLISSTRKGNRPSFTNAAGKEKGKDMGNLFHNKLKTIFPSTKYGVFQAYMKVHLINDGPFTIIIDSFDRLRSRRKG